MNTHCTQIRVRYAETDKMQVVYHGNYAQYFEIGRIEWLRNKGISYKELEETGILLPVVSLIINYKKPAHYDELLELHTELKNLTSVKIEFDYKLYNDKQELLTTGSSILVFVDATTMRATKVPQFMKNILTNI